MDFQFRRCDEIRGETITGLLRHASSVSGDHVAAMLKAAVASDPVLAAVVILVLARPHRVR
jgi:hypothetical protein